jgi:hypothetical protein
VVDKKIWPFNTKNGTKSGKSKFSTTYFVGTRTIKIIGKLTGLKKNDVNYRKTYIPKTCEVLL